MNTPSDTASNGTAPSGAEAPDAIRADIERTRAELADTVDELHARLDVKARTKAKLADFMESTTTGSGKPRPVVVVGTAGGIALLAGLIWWKRR